MNVRIEASNSFLKVFFFIMLSMPVLSQSPRKELDSLAGDLQSLSENNPQTTIYLQTSKGLYEVGEDLWFKAYSLDARYLMPSVLDITLYVQLNRVGTDSIVWQEKYKIVNGFSDGHLFLDELLDSGEYFLKAYTKYSFQDYSKEFNSVRKVKIVNRIESEIDSLVSNKPLNVSAENIQFDFFPEGGHLINEVESKVAFKAVTANGSPLDVSGAIYETDVPVLKFKTDHVGMGSFDFLPKATKKYYAQLHFPKKVTVAKYDLPKIQNNGVVLHLKERDNEKLVFKVSGTSSGQRVYLRTQVRGLVQTMATGILNDSIDISIPIKDFPSGICEVTLFNKEFKPLAERLVYVNTNKKLYIAAQLSKETYGTREKVTIKIEATDANSNPVSANLGLSVHDKIYDNVNDGKDILTHYHLSTQLKGAIYNPEYYFNEKNKTREEALDLLMLTQGWRKYVWNENIQGGQKKVQVLKDGIHGNIFTIKKRKDAQEQKMIMVFNPENDGNPRLVPLDSSKSFYIGPDFLNMGRRFYIKHFGTEDHKIGLNVTDEFHTINDRDKGYKINYPIPVIEKESSRSVSMFKIRGGIQLEEVSINGKRSKVFRDKYLGQLDSLAKLDINSDYVGGPCGTLNCQVHEFHSDNYKPVEGKTYSQMMGFKWTNNRSAYTITGHQRVKYTYPQYTEAET